MRTFEKIKKANDIRNLRPSEYEALAGQIREFLIEIGRASCRERV